MQRIIHILTQGYCELDVLKSYVQDCLVSEVHFISPFQLTHALGSVYWLRQKQHLAYCFPLKKIHIWMTYFDAPGLAMGGLRLGVQHIIYKGHLEHLRKLQSLGNGYQARVVSSHCDI